MKTKKIFILLILPFLFFACHKNDDNNTDPTPGKKRVSTIHVDGSIESNYTIAYTSFNKIASFVKTIGADTQTTTYHYNPTNQRLERYTNIFSDGSIFITNILYDANGKVIGIENSGTVSDVTETLNGFTVILSGDPVSYTFNAEEQLTSIQHPTANVIFDANPSIKGPLHEVEMDRVFYLSVLEIIYLTKQGLNRVNNFDVPELQFSNTVDASGYLTSSIVDSDAANPSNSTFSVSYTYSNF